MDPRQRYSIIEQTLDRIFELIKWTFNRVGDIRLTAFSEYGIIGQYRPRTVEEWIDLAGPIPGPVTDRIGEVAKRPGIYVVGNVYERDDS